MGWSFMQEHLGSFLLELLAAVVGAWIFTAWYPSISDYRAHRSTRATERKIAELENSLRHYETDFADAKLFMGASCTYYYNYNYNGSDCHVLYDHVIYSGKLVDANVSNTIATMRGSDLPSKNFIFSVEIFTQRNTPNLGVCFKFCYAVSRFF
jgi:hypothetical protein